MIVFMPPRLRDHSGYSAESLRRLRDEYDRALKEMYVAFVVASVVVLGALAFLAYDSPTHTGRPAATEVAK